jgi:hypothetical protein
MILPCLDMVSVPPHNCSNVQTKHALNVDRLCGPGHRAMVIRLNVTIPDLSEVHQNAELSGTRLTVHRISYRLIPRPHAEVLNIIVLRCRMRGSVLPLHFWAFQQFVRLGYMNCTRIQP